jgi:C-terminal processing protease CtpA/Prc
MRISRDGKTACWSPVGDYIYFTENRGGHNNGIWRVKAPDGVVRGERVPFIGHVDVDLRKELGDLFDEMWSALRDGFYDEKVMTAKKGAWWQSMKTKYRAMAIDTENKDEFHSVIRQMLAELGASHLGVFGGQRPGNSVTPPADQNGYFGFDLEQDPLDDGSRRVASIVPKSPADEAGMRVGDVVTRINRAKLKKKTNLDKSTIGLVGKPVEVRFKPRTESGLGPERAVQVEPIDIQKIWSLKYDAWVATCARCVGEATEKEKWKLGYIHLRGMNSQYLQKFRQAVTQWNRNKKIKAMVLDVRNNGGGRIHLELMQVLTAKPLARVKRRGRPAVIQPGLYWDKPVVLLINERSFSDAEVFPHMFREAGLGTIVGVPTAGGVIGTGMVTLSDGSAFRIPGTGFKTMDGKDLEGLGVEPDILVEETSEDRLEGRDPQLKKALEIVMGEVRERVKAEEEKKKKAKPAKKAEPEKKKEEPKEPAPDLAASEMNPLADVRAGEWVRYRLTDPTSGEETVLKVSVARIEGDVVHFEKEIEEGGLAIVPLPEQMKRASVLDILPSFGKLMSHSTIEGKVKETATRILVAQIQWLDGSSLRLSFTNAVPAYGLLKVEMGKMIVLEAVEWGEAAAPEPEAKAEEPEAKPAEPEAKPAEPEAKPAEPEAKPAEPEAVKKKAEEKEFEVPAHPIHDAKVGEWVKIRRFGPGGQSVDTIVKVVEVTDDEVAYEQTVFLPNREVTSPTIRRDRREKLVPPENLDLKGYSREEVTVGENTFDCVIMTVEDATGAELKIYYCHKVPFNGVVRMERDGETIMEIVEWGTGE